MGLRVLFTGLAAALLAASTAAPAAAKGWQGVVNPQYGPVAALTGHEVLPIILVTCRPEGVQMSVQIAPGYPIPDPGDTLWISLQGNRNTDLFEQLDLEPMPAQGEYATFLSQQAITMIAGTESSLGFSYSIDGGTVFSRGDPDIDLTGSSAAMKPVLAACNATAAPSSDMRAEETLRQAVDAHFGYYRLPFGSMPDYSGRIPFSRAVNALIDQTEMGAIDYDPFCQCQDYDENAFFYAIRSVKVTGDRGEAVVSVKAVASAELSVITLKLLREGGKWVVDDVIDAGGSLRDYLRE